jgi:hypothetical protein
MRKIFVIIIFTACAILLAYYPILKTQILKKQFAETPDERYSVELWGLGKGGKKAVADVLANGMDLPKSEYSVPIPEGAIPICMTAENEIFFGPFKRHEIKNEFVASLKATEAHDANWNYVKYNYPREAQIICRKNISLTPILFCADGKSSAVDFMRFIKECYAPECTFCNVSIMVKNGDETAALPIRCLFSVSPEDFAFANNKVYRYKTHHTIPPSWAFMILEDGRFRNLNNPMLLTVSEFVQYLKENATDNELVTFYLSENAKLRDVVKAVVAIENAGGNFSYSFAAGPFSK